MVVGGASRLAPVFLPSHSSATDINKSSTSGFTLLSAVNRLVPPRRDATGDFVKRSPCPRGCGVGVASGESLTSNLNVGTDFRSSLF